MRFKTSKVTSLVITPLFIFFCNASCTKNTPSPTETGVLPPAGTNSDMNAVAAKDAKLTATFKQINDGIEVNLAITGLQANSEHGLHIHAVGECNGLDFKTAGDHFNPQSKNHGAPGDSNAHLGDLGNITTDGSGNFSGNIKIKNATRDGANGILRRSLIVHQNADDLKSQPSGESGDRIACVVINSVD